MTLTQLALYIANSTLTANLAYELNKGHKIASCCLLCRSCLLRLF